MLSEIRNHTIDGSCGVDVCDKLLLISAFRSHGKYSRKQDDLSSIQTTQFSCISVSSNRQICS